MIVDQMKPSCLVENNQLYNSLVTDSTSTHSSLTDSSSLTDLLSRYEEEMTNYIYAVPHIPPTMFELKLRHSDVKNAIIAKFLDENDSVKASMRSRLASQIDKLFATVVMKNMHEYKACQTGFIIGWKCSINKPNNNSRDCRSQVFDDRF